MKRKIAVDLHIHSALSPCAEEEMTPNNIVNMALLKGLDAIAVTDHNSMENYPALLKCAENKGIVVIPGMEVESREEVHLVCLFPDGEIGQKFQQIIYDSLPETKNRPDIFGQQIIMDENDEIIGYNDRFLLTATTLGLEEIFSIVTGSGGVVIPAHVDRDSYSIISNLGMVPASLNIKYLEISRLCDEQKFRAKTPGLYDYSFIKSSDAHSLGHILERESFIELDEVSVEGILSALQRLVHSDN